MNEHNLIVDFIGAMDRAIDVESCFAALSQAVESLGFTGIVYTSIPTSIAPAPGNTPVFLRSRDFDEHFIEHYTEAGFAADDFTIKRIIEGDLGRMEWWNEERKGLLIPAERRVIETAREEYGIRNGISIPTLATGNQIAGASVVSNEWDGPFDQLLRERLPLLQSMIRLFHDRVYSNIHLQKFFYGRILDNLSERERTLLKFSALGLPLKVYEDLYGISPSAAGNQRSRLFRKLGMKNSGELMYMVGLLRLLDAL